MMNHVRDYVLLMLGAPVVSLSAEVYALAEEVAAEAVRLDVPDKNEWALKKVEERLANE
jgi:hypothetical protein